MKILIVSSFLPFPLYSGGQVRLFNLIKELSKNHETTLICEKRTNQTTDDVKEIEKICKKVIAVNRRKQWTIENIVNSGISSKSFLASGHTHKEMNKIIKNELAENVFDLIHVETYYVMQNLPETSIPIVLAEHNIEYQVYKRFVQNSPLALRPLLNLDIAKIKKEEEACWKNAARLIAVSKEDSSVMEQQGVNPIIVANGVDTVKFKSKIIHSTSSVQENQKSKIKKILFMGDFKWIQNRDAVKFIIEDIWPQICSHSGKRSAPRISNTENQRDPGQARMTDVFNIKLWIVGRNIPESIKKLTNDPDIIFDEKSSGMPTEQIFQDADVLLAPIRVGGGTSYKILESMSCGTPVVTMPMSAESIEATSNQDIMTGQTASELAEKTLELLGDEELYNKLAINGRKLIERKYTWKKIAGDLERIYQDAAHK